MKQHFLVVGDWFVDNYWVCAPQRTEGASRIGEQHIRAMHGIDSTVRTLCGAGEIASLLVLAETQPLVTGLGHWHTGDTGHLKSLLFPEFCKGDNPFKVNPSIRVPKHDKTLDRCRLLPLSDAAPGECKIGTNRVWRIFEHTAQGFQHKTRIDWIQSNQLPALGTSRIDTLIAQINAGRPQVSGVIVKDHAYGVVTRELIRGLVREYGEVPWFVTSKGQKPDWFADLPPDTVQMLLLPKEIATITRDPRSGLPVHKWIIGEAIPSHGAMNILEDYAGYSARRSSATRPFRNAAIVAQQDSTNVVALFPPEKRGRLGAVVKTRREAKNDEAHFVPRASIFFAAAVHFRTAIHQPWAEALHSALGFASEWAEQEKQRIGEPKGWESNKKVLPAPAASRNADGQPGVRLPRREAINFDWENAATEWRSAQERLGIVTLANSDRAPTRRLEIWRSMTEVGGLIAVDLDRRRVISDLCQELETFKRGKRESSRSFYIGDHPGFGKSWLVNSLAETFEFDPVELDITELHKADDLWEYFDRIVAKHQKSGGKPILVFVDEANAPVQGQNVYSWFLRPIENRQYHSRGETFRLPACVWIFAGTENLTRRAATNRAKQLEHLKVSDFVSRLSKAPYFLGDGRPGEDGMALERVYVGAQSIKSRFSDVQEVSVAVLKAFQALGRNCSLREIRNHVNDFHGVVGERVVVKNFGERLLTKLGAVTRKRRRWANAADDKVMVELALTPPPAAKWHPVQSLVVGKRKG